MCGPQTDTQTGSGKSSMKWDHHTPRETGKDETDERRFETFLLEGEREKRKEVKGSCRE